MTRVRRLLVAAGLSLLLLPIGLLLGAELSLKGLALLWLAGTLLGLSLFGFRVLIGGAALVALLVGIFLFTPLLPWLAQSLVVNQAPQPADLIVTLGGGMHCGEGQLEASSLARVEKGLELWKAGYAPRITLSDTVGEIFGDSHCPSLGLEAQKRVQALYGASGPEILLLRQMRTTHTEALATAELARARGFRQILLVTAPTHSRRALATFKKLGLEVTSVVSSEPRFDMAMVKPIDRLKGLEAVVREYLGLLVYRLRGWI